MSGVWKNENGVPLTRVKQLAPGKTNREIQEMNAMWKAKADAGRADANSYQKERRHRIKLGRDIMGGNELNPRRVIPPGAFGISPRVKKPITINSDAGAQMEAAMDGVVGEPGTRDGDADWEKFKMEREKGKLNYNKITMPDD